ncbi:MAG: hypothetical protein GWM92_20875 [Gemmatimonadetes bacterium]|nr:hypothetical protein [Gemmatimonadota bacterium]NIR81312.1 hypothetical protein [Gemmatimonadota bacterium]NIT90141.1 hypothetical protein [Gemmatimonadota bacterium]NIU33973.1 hypothetical protein [Gemmatimonadota bacterium]NIU38144.1 hypothetical protein [Gemmatimonadota bacterium]
MEPLSPDELRELGMSGREIRELVAKLRPSPERPDFELDLGAMRPAEAVEKEMYEAVPGSFE